jgi:hypothetical protein
MTMNTAARNLTILLGLTVCIPSAHAELRRSFRDDEVVARSELIVVGHLRPGTIEYVPHQTRPGDGRSWEHHAILTITQVLKGSTDAEELPIVIHHGLNPLVRGQQTVGGHVRASIPGRPYPPGSIQIMDTGNSSFSLTPLVPDARDDHLWFLRTHGPSPTSAPAVAPDRLGIYDPEDLQPITLKEYFLAYLATDPEKAVREQFAKNTAIGARALRYLQRLEIRRIAQDPDPARRAERLMPYYLSQTGGFDHDAQTALTACGPTAGPYLLVVFDDPFRRSVRPDILRIWGVTRYPGCVARLITLLHDADAHFARVTTQPGWQASDAGSGDNSQIYAETYYSVCALGEIGDPSAREVIEQTLARWKPINYSNPQIVEACEQALKRFEGGARSPGR